MKKDNDFLSGKLLKADDVAKKLNVSRAKVYQLMRDGDIPSVRVGKSRRVITADLQNYIQRNRVSV